MRHLPLLSAAALIAFALPLPSLAAGAYAEAVFQTSNQTFQSENAVGAPDGTYASFFEKDAFVTLDMGADVEASGLLTISYQLLDFGATYRIEFLDDQMLIVATKSDFVPLSQNEMIVDPGTNVSYRYVRITSVEEEKWNIDAVMAESVVLAEEPEAQPEEEPEAPSDQGLLVKLLDDGDAMTTADAAVFIIGADGMRHAFPNEVVYFSWFRNFNEVAYIDPVNLMAYPLGADVTMRPGTHLVKLAADPRVYAVEPGGTLRWVTSETIATTLYGVMWASRVVDVSDAMFATYELGASLTTAIHPDGTVGVLLTTGEVVYIDNGVYHSIGNLSRMRFHSDFFSPISSELSSLYIDGDDLADDPMIQWPY